MCLQIDAHRRLELGSVGNQADPLPFAVRPRKAVRPIAIERRYEKLVTTNLRSFFEDSFRTGIRCERLALFDTERRKQPYIGGRRKQPYIGVNFSTRGSSSMIRFNTSQNWMLSSHLREVLSIAFSVVSTIAIGFGLLAVLRG